MDTSHPTAPDASCQADINLQLLSLLVDLAASVSSLTHAVRLLASAAPMQIDAEAKASGLDAYNKLTELAGSMKEVLAEFRETRVNRG